MDRTGNRYGKLVVFARLANGPNGSARWRCKCDCGNFHDTTTGQLTSGKTAHCGCSPRWPERMRNGEKDPDRKRLRKIRYLMLYRCSSPKSPNYRDYGGRGISVCDEWRDLEVFIDWAMANGYRSDLTIDRIDANGNYEPGNCRWATYSEQNRNKRDNRLIEVGVTIMCAVDAAKLFGVHYETLRSRLNRGVPAERAVNPSRI